MSTSTRHQPKGFHASAWHSRTPWIRSTGTDWLERFVRPRVTRRPRDDSASVKWNIAITRRLTRENTPKSIGMKPPSATRPIPVKVATTTMTTSTSAGTMNSVDSRKLPTSAPGETVTSVLSATPESKSTCGAGPSTVSESRVEAPCARASR